MQNTSLQYTVRPTIKNCWFAVLLPTCQNWPYPKNFMAILRKIFFFQKSKNKDSFSQNYSFQNLFYVLTKDGNEWQICYSNILIHYSNVFEYSGMYSNIRIRKSSMFTLRFQPRDFNSERR